MIQRKNLPVPQTMDEIKKSTSEIKTKLMKINTVKSNNISEIKTELGKINSVKSVDISTYTNAQARKFESLIVS